MIRGPRLVTALVVVLLLLLGAAVAGVVRATTSPRTVTVLASWSGDEEKAFRTVLAEFTRRYGVEVDYQGTSAQREVLRSEVQAGAPPDVAILSSPGELAAYAREGEVIALGGTLGGTGLDAYDQPWLPELGVRGRSDIYWVPVKADLKSIVWYDPERYAAEPGGRPAGPPADGDAWCLGMGADATSGWPGTDWVEDLLLQQSGTAVYEEWATGGRWNTPAMRKAWRTWAETLGGKGSGRAEEALTTDLETASKGLFTEPPACALDHQASFIRGVHGSPEKSVGTRPGDFLPSAEVLPGTAGRGRAWEVAGDFAAMFRDSPEAKELIRFLASAEAQEHWAVRAPATMPRPLSANSRVPQGAYEPDSVTRRLARNLRDPLPQCLDASDAMPPTMGDAFRHAALRFLDSAQEFAADPGKLDGLLGQLDEVSAQVKEEGGTWLPAVCG
ncbi:extracellular solute-binding protein [Streptomyces odonnellii]|uniref:extracellular solute-binding protein n=1 Tax=Streptomyces odonnellii TaxID=1417980 RepID=UPI0006250B50|nr:extracellular solute-binding protein [Streptomyces odonnellii]